MKRSDLVFLLLVSLLCCACGVEEDAVMGEDSESVPSEGGVGVGREDVGDVELPLLNDDNFLRAVKNVDFMVVEFYTPWCHHCASMLTVLGELSGDLQAEGVSFARVDIEQSKELKARYQINAVPDIRILRRGVASPYTGPSESDGKQALIDYFLEEAAIPLEEGPIELTVANFDSIVKATPIMLVEFYAEWCVHCQQLEPHFHAAARRLRYSDPPVLLGQVQIPDQMEVAKRYGVEGYPLLIVFRYGREYNYTGPREEEGIVSYMKKQAGPPSQLLSSAAETKAFARSNTEIRAIGFFSKSTKPELLERYMETGNRVRMDMELGHTTDEAVAKEMGFKTNTIVVFHPRNYVSSFEEGHSVIKTIPTNQDVLMKQLMSHSRPLVGHMTEDNQLSVYHDRPLLVGYMDLSWDLHAKTIRYWHNIIASVAKDYTPASKKQLIFAIADEQEFPTDIKLLGLSDWGEDIAVGIFGKDGVRFALTEELTSESLKEFIDDFLGKGLRPKLNSEPTPKSNKGSAIKKVVGNTFEKFMGDKSKNRLIKLCMPDAPQCKKAGEYFPKVVARYEGMDEVVFGEMNMALNDVPPSVKLDGILPTFLFARKGSKDIIQVAPKPTDDADLVFFLKVRHSIRPTLSERDIALRSKYKKNKEGKKEKKSDKKKSKKDEL